MKAAAYTAALAGITCRGMFAKILSAIKAECIEIKLVF